MLPSNEMMDVLMFCNRCLSCSVILSIKDMWQFFLSIDLA